jgi:hypothetical protein
MFWCFKGLILQMIDQLCELIIQSTIEGFECAIGANNEAGMAVEHTFMLFNF